MPGEEWLLIDRTHSPARTALVFGALVASLGCPLGQSGWLARYQRDIDAASKAIARASTDDERARADNDRGRGYSEKARYSRSFKLIQDAEYTRLFDLAIKDHDQAVALGPGIAQVYLGRGLTSYGRAALDQAIADFTQEMALDPHAGRLRLAETYCRRASVRQLAKQYELAIADYEKAIALQLQADSCDCQPEAALASCYLETKQFDKSWEVVRKARQSKRWIAPETIEQLRQASGRQQ